MGYLVIESEANATLPDLLSTRMTQALEAPAVIAADGVLSYGELWDRARGVRRALEGRGLGPGSLVGICVERDVNLVPAMLGVLLSGAAYVPIEPTFPAQRIAQMLEDAAPGAVLVSAKHRDMLGGLESLGKGAPDLITVEEIEPAGPERGPGAPGPGPDDLAYVIYTSGSTGKPKGVMVCHKGLANILRSAADLIGAGPRDRFLAVTTVCFDIAGLDFFVPLLTGGTVVLAKREDALDGRRLASLLDEHGITVMQATPATWRMLVDAGWQGRRGLRGMIGAEALPRPLAEALLKRLDALWNMYGPTETSIWSTAHRVTSGEGPVPIGRALANTTLAILDEQGRPAAEGELYIGGVGVARGYLNRDELTASRFLPDPERPGERLYRTGDLCRWREGGGEDGVLMYIGRVDHQVKIRGYRVELGDVESVLIGHPAIHEVIAGTREDGEGHALVVYATLNPGAALTLGELRRWAAQRLPGYMVPTGLTIVEAMPRTATGKTDRKALAAMGAAAPPAPAVEASVPEAHDDLELAVVKVFREVLGVHDLGPADDFFDVGGHSLLAFRAAQEIQARTGRTVDVALLFKHPSARALAGVLRSHGGMAVPAASIDLQPLGDRAPVLCVCGLALYLPIARGLAPQQPVSAIYVDADLAVFHEGNGRARALTIEGVADRYVEEVRRRQPHGPYRLLGFSMGGAVAFEVARRLIGAGERVDLVAMIDTALAESVSARPVELARHIASRTVTRGPRWVLGRIASALALGKGRVVETGPAAPMDEAARQRWVVETRGRAIMASYRPRPLKVDAVLFTAAGRERLRYLRYEEDGGWGRIVKGRLTVRAIPGDHRDLVANPRAAAMIAREIREQLRPIDEPEPAQDDDACRLAAAV